MKISDTSFSLFHYLCVSWWLFSIFNFFMFSTCIALSYFGEQYNLHPFQVFNLFQCVYIMLLYSACIALWNFVSVYNAQQNFLQRHNPGQTKRNTWQHVLGRFHMTHKQMWPIRSINIHSEVGKRLRAAQSNAHSNLVWIIMC